MDSFSATRHVHEDAEATSGDTIAAFPRSSHIAIAGRLPVTFVVTEDLLPIKIEKVPGTIKLLCYIE